MPFKTTRELLDSVLADRALTSDELDRLIADHVTEDQYLDYKDGKLLETVQRAAKVVREYVSGFANADGGVLVVGVSEKRSDGRRTVSGCKKPGQTELSVWAKDTLLDMASHFSPPPRFQVVEHPDGEVLVCAVARAPNFVPCVESRRMKYFLRIHDSTVECPEYLISDLVLGRRNHPVFHVELTGVSLTRGAQTTDSANTKVDLLPVDLIFRVENVSLVPADQVTLGIVSWSPNGAGVNELLEFYIQKGDTQHFDQDRLHWELEHARGPTGNQPYLNVEPFVPVTGRIVNALLLPNYHGLDPITSAAVYVLPKGGSPSWFQFRFATTGIKVGEQNADWNARKLGRLYPSSRPLVHWERIGHLDE